ncbi:MAG TPA: FecR domain-containing protein [Steroidobacteraceae bacterium]|jgi:hypothetical protein
MAVEDAWSASVNRRKIIRAMRGWLVASVSILTIGLGAIAFRYASAPQPQLIATIVGTRGSVRILPLAGHVSIVAGDVLSAKTRIETGPNGTALLSLGSVGVRVGPVTELELERPGRIRLKRGKIYVDSGETARPDALVVATEFGNLAHRGTQYQVQVQPKAYLFTSVREGRILLQDHGATQSVERGEGLRVAETNEITRSVIPPYDAQWQWVSEFVPEFSIEGQSLSVFLDWFARETGRRLVFVGPTSRNDTDRTTLKGSIGGLTPTQALNAVVVTTQFQCDLATDAEVRVNLRPGRPANMSRNAASPAVLAGPSR